MKNVIVLFVILQVSAFAGILQDQALESESESDIFVYQAYAGIYWSALSFSDMGSNDYWLACDYTPPTGETAEFRGFGAHICYQSNNPNRLGDITFEVYKDDFNSAAIASFTCDESEITQVDTGWEATTFNPPKDIYWIEMTFEEADWVGGLAGDTQYWIAAQMDSSDDVCIITTDLEYGEVAWQKYLNGYWESTSAYYYGHEDFDLATRILGGGLIGIETVSLGEIKMAFK